MKKILAFFVLIIFVGCSNQVQKDYLSNRGWKTFPRYEPPETSVTSPTASLACNDSLFVILQQKQYNSMTAYEHSYFEQKWSECNGTLNSNKGSGPEWIMAVITKL